MSEHDVERQIRDYLRIALPDEVVVWHTPNGAQLGARQLWQMRAAGMVAGIPDRCFVHAGRAYFAEVKGPRGRLSDAQVGMHERLRRAGCPVVVVRSVEELEAALLDWGLPLRTRMLGL